MISGKIILVLLIVIGAMALGGAWYWDYSQGKLQEQASKIAEQKVALQIQEKTIAKMKADQELQDAIRKGVEAGTAGTRKDVEEMRKKFVGTTKSGAQKNLGKAAIERPLIIQTAVNKGTADQFRCFEVLSGAPLKEEEKNGKSTNKICPELFAGQ